MLKFLLTLVLVVVAVTVVGAVALVVLGDSDDDPGGPSSSGAATPVSTVTGELTADAVLQQASLAAGEVTSFHFVLSHENGSTPLPLNLELEAAEGDVIVPASLAAEVDAEAVGINVTVRIIGIDGRTWITNPFTRDWQELPNTNIRDFADPAALVSGLLPSITEAELREGERIDGVETHLITGSITTEALREALGLAEPGRTVKVEAWVGVDDKLPRRIRLTGPLTDAEAPNVVRQVEISRYDEPVEIMPPE
jgi:lipoprotein LprG